MNPHVAVASIVYKNLLLSDIQDENPFQMKMNMEQVVFRR